MALILKENQLLKDKKYKIPKNLQLTLAHAFASNQQFKEAEGYKKVLHLLNPSYNDRSVDKSAKTDDGIPYSNLKKLQMLFQQADPQSLEYNLLGGEEMKSWVKDTLNRERNKVQPQIEKIKSDNIKKGMALGTRTPKTSSIKCGNAELQIHEVKKSIFNKKQLEILKENLDKK